MILRQKAFLEEMNHRIGKAVTALYDFAKNRDLIFSKEEEDSIANGIIAEAILKELDPTDEDPHRTALRRDSSLEGNSCNFSARCRRKRVASASAVAEEAPTTNSPTGMERRRTEGEDGNGLLGILFIMV